MLFALLNSFWLRGRRCLFLPLPDRQGAAIAWLAGEVRGPLGARFAETCLKGVSVHLIYPELRSAFGQSVGHLVVNDLRRFGRVDGDLRLEEDLSCHRRGRLVSLADSFHLRDHLSGHRLAVRGP